MARLFKYLKENGSIICVMLTLILFFLSLLVNSSSDTSERVAQKTAKRIEKRMETLDSYMAQALEGDHSQWLEMPDLPEDLVIYRYVYDTLQCWCNQFTVSNDDISSRMVFQKLSNMRSSISSPLRDVRSRVTYMNLGPKWYLVKSVTDNANCKVIGGIEIKNTLVDNMYQLDNGVNPYFRLPARYSIQPINYSGGSPVYFGNVPLFKVISDTVSNSPFVADSILRWLSLILVVVATVLYLLGHRTCRVFSITFSINLLASAVAYIWGVQIREASSFFSPTVYADGYFLYSFGALMILTLTILVCAACIYMMRKTFLRNIVSFGKKWTVALYAGVIFAISLSILIYAHFLLSSIILNSNISLDLFLWTRFNSYSLAVYLAYAFLTIAALMLMLMSVPALRILTGRRSKINLRTVLVCYSVLCALHFTVTSGYVGDVKEQNKVSVWANRLAIDRDLEVELMLRGVEDQIASDPLISALAEIDRSVVVNRITEVYLGRIVADYDISAVIASGSDVQTFDYMKEKISGGVPIYDGSRFLFVTSPDGKSGYAGLFLYYSAQSGMTRLLLEIEPKTNKDDRGYYSILGKYVRTSDVNIPQYYSYAKYSGDKLVTYKGIYSYSTVLSPSMNEALFNGARRIDANGYVHFVRFVSDDELIVISRKGKGKMTYAVTFSYLVFLIYGTLWILTRRRRKDALPGFKRNYFRSRINWILTVSLTSTIVIMSLFSISFVYSRNESNRNNLMSDKVTTIQTLLESKLRHFNGYSDLNSQDLLNIIEEVAATTKSDITLYTPSGRAFRSTTPEVFDRMLVGFRINQNAYYNIRYLNQRFFINREHIGSQAYYSLYAPLFNHEGRMIAIMSAPYTDSSYDFSQEAFSHAVTIVNVFLVLLLVTLLFSTSVVNALFRPLVTLGQRMKSVNIHNLEFIIYSREDEVSILVDAYNRMVHALSESMKQLTQTERDKAWSEMARQVAHEIKNPLTPIKLEIQRLIRLKQRNDPSWEAKFDKVASVVLEHIDILTDTANEFSTFAKLYSEEPVEMDLDKTLKDQLEIFNNKDNVKMTYIGLSDARVMAPKPQLIRVFVNLLSNAVQAVEIQRKEIAGDDAVLPEGKIVISLRNSMKEGFYDVVFEDNGPGVSEENLSKLFTPNFTTKSSGTGLGLAISRNIVEKCGGEITYKKSFGLNGACFTVRIPKMK
ncbi:MAG: ATP-binding protein [Candidatus Cryptobacteroides sp.]